MSLEVISDCAAVSYGDPDHLIIMFSSTASVRRGDFDFKDFSRDLPQTILFLRDDDVRTGYHNGINGLTSNIDETVEFLRYFVRKMGPKRVTMFGTSIGGFAALTHGPLLGVDDIITVGTVSFVDPAVRDAKGGKGERVPLSMAWGVEWYAKQGRAPKYLDALQIFEANPGKVAAVKMYYSPEDEVDEIQSLHLADLPNVQAIARPGTSHRYIALQLVRDGTLARDFATPTDQLLRADADAAIV
jgi:pimeloyl-ACP methyl ester carboxylesterase